VDQVWADLARLLSDTRDASRSGPSPAVDQVWAADVAHLLTDVMNAYQLGLSSLEAMRLHADARALTGP
jgi:hypothetical protein